MLSILYTKLYLKIKKCFEKLGDFIVLDPDPDFPDLVDPDPHTINEDPHPWGQAHFKNRGRSRDKKGENTHFIFLLLLHSCICI